MNDAERPVRDLKPGSPDLMDDASGARDTSRVRFKGIVEADIMDESRADNAPTPSTGPIVEDGAELVARVEAPATPLLPVSVPHRNWNALSRQVWQTTSWGAVFLFFFMAIGWPVGAFWAHLEQYGASNGWLASFFSFGWLSTFFSFFGPEHALVTVFVPALIFLCGYILSHAFKMLHAAQFIASAAQQFIQPDKSAVYNAESVGLAVRGQMEALNTGVDGALQSLAAVEAMIRNHVTAIEHAGTAIEQRASGAVDKVATERSRLIELTENLNAQADAFATAIAERAQTGVVAMGEAGTVAAKAESDLDERLSRLEAAASKALTSFQSLNDAIRGADNSFQTSASALETSAEKTRSATSNAADAARAAAEDLEQSLESAAASIETKAADFTQREGEKITSASREALERAARDAEQATTAAKQAQDAAREAAESTSKTADDLLHASSAIRKSAETAVADSNAAADAARENIDARNKALSEARAALEKENTRLEALIEEQRQRADRLADAIATQTERLAEISTTPSDAPSAPAEPAIPHEPARTDAPASRNPGVLTLRSAAVDTPPARPETSSSGPVVPGPDGHRLEELARDIAERRPKPAPQNNAGKTQQRKKQGRKEAPSSPQSEPVRAKGDVSWREILDAAEDSEPLDLAAASKSPPAATKPASSDTKAQNGAATAKAKSDADTDRAMQVVHDLQDFSRDLETRLYGDPPPALAERFDRGDRNVFANRILRLNEADVKRRIRSESARDKAFEKTIHAFLQGFESLLEDATTSQTADEELEEYLSSPLGRVYLLIGATVGYFA